MSSSTAKRKLSPNIEVNTRKRLRTETGSNDTIVESGAIAVVAETLPIVNEESVPIDSNSNGMDVDSEKRERHQGVISTPANPPATKATHKIRKLVPPRPFPTVPTSVSATGPRSAHTEGKNFICLTRKTQLGAYLRRCKDVFLKDGYRTLHLNAMGAAIPHLMQLALSLPTILPFAPEEIHTEVQTGTVEVQDELIPEDEDEDITYRSRGKSVVNIVIKVGNGVDETSKGGNSKTKTKSTTVAAIGGGQNSGKANGRKGKGAGNAPSRSRIQENVAAPV